MLLLSLLLELLLFVFFLFHSELKFLLISFFKFHNLFGSLSSVLDFLQEFGLFMLEHSDPVIEQSCIILHRVISILCIEKPVLRFI